MKNIKITIKNLLFIASLSTILIGCDKDFASIGTGIIGSNNFNANDTLFSVLTYNKPVGPVQSNNLTSYLLGYNNDAIYGSSTANVVTQLAAGSYDSSFGYNPVLDSVVLTIPYHSTPLETDENGNITYKLDSIFGNDPIKLSIYQNNFFLRDFNPNSEFNDSQRYYSNGTTDEDTFIPQNELEGVLLYEDLEFLPSEDQIILTQFDESLEEPAFVETAKLAPAIRVKLNNPNDNYWQNLIFAKEGEPELSNLNNFLEYFRGLYFKAESVGLDGTIMLLDMLSSSATLTLYYSNSFEDIDDDNDGIPNYADADIDGDGTNDNGNDEDSDGINDAFDVNKTGGTDANGDGIDDDITTEQNSYDMSFTGNAVNILDNNYISIPEGDVDNGDEKLFLKGAEGSMAVINLFNGDDDGNSADLDYFKSRNWLVNEANLVFYVDQNLVQGNEPERLYIYDLNNNVSLIDYFLDQSVSDTQINAKLEHLRPLIRLDEDPDGQGVKYKIDITEHINNILVRDSTNVKLGLVVTANVNSINNLVFLNTEENSFNFIEGALLSPQGTVLYGSNSSDLNKKARFEIYYTEPIDQD